MPAQLSYEAMKNNLKNDDSGKFKILVDIGKDHSLLDDRNLLYRISRNSFRLIIISAPGQHQMVLFHAKGKDPVFEADVFRN